MSLNTDREKNNLRIFKHKLKPESIISSIIRCNYMLPTRNPSEIIREKFIQSKNIEESIPN